MSRFTKFIIIVCIVVICVIIFSFQFIVKVKTECESQYGDCPGELVFGIRNLESKNLYLTRQKVSKYLRSNIQISDYSTQFKFPNILKVDILIKKPSYQIKSNEKSILVDKDGIVLSTNRNDLIPTLIITSDLKKIGEKIDDNQLFLLKLIEGVNEMYQINVGKLSDIGLTVELTPNIEVIFPIDGDTQVLLGSLRLVYTKIEGNISGTYSQIDLRFKSPVLR